MQPGIQDIHPSVPEVKAKDISLRDYFAAHAIEEDIRLNQVRAEDGKKILSREEARYRYADSMLKARTQETK